MCAKPRAEPPPSAMPTVRAALVRRRGVVAWAQSGPVLAIDGVQAGVGDRVLLVQDGKAAMAVLDKGLAAVDAAVVGVIDQVDLQES